ncbi:hypothetical protein MRX96_008969 [Rhipicephalus microplus]
MPVASTCTTTDPHTPPATATTTREDRKIPFSKSQPLENEGESVATRSASQHDPTGDSADTERFQQVLNRGARRRRARDIAAAAAIPVDQTIVGTVLYRPSASGGTFVGFPCLVLAQALSSRPWVAAICVNLKRNVVAADASTRECHEQLLTIKELRAIAVSAREPADHNTSTSFLCGVDGEPADDSLLPGIKSAVSVLAATREGCTVTLRFTGPVLLEHVTVCWCSFHFSRPGLALCSVWSVAGSATSKKVAAGQADAYDVGEPAP